MNFPNLGIHVCLINISFFSCHLIVVKLNENGEFYELSSRGVISHLSNISEIPVVLVVKANRLPSVSMRTEQDS